MRSLAIVRIHKSFAHLIPGIPDQGILGIQISEVENAREARAIARLAKYPPIGNRGISGQGPHTGYESYGRHATEYAPWANENIIICPSIESLEGLENVEEIAAVEGIDMIAYGHSDLSAQLGVHLDLELVVDQDSGRAQQAMRAMMQMSKIDIAALERAAAAEAT